MQNVLSSEWMGLTVQIQDDWLAQTASWDDEKNVSRCLAPHLKKIHNFQKWKTLPNQYEARWLKNHILHLPLEEIVSHCDALNQLNTSMTYFRHWWWWIQHCPIANMQHKHPNPCQQHYKFQANLPSKNCPDPILPNLSGSNKALQLVLKTIIGCLSIMEVKR